MLIEGGAGLAAAALRARIVDRLFFFIAPTLLGGDGRAMVGPLGVSTLSDALSVQVLGVSRLGPDLLVRGVPERRAPGPGRASLERRQRAARGGGPGRPRARG